MARKQRYEKKVFESTLQPSDVSANIYESMLLSAAWQDLSATAKVLYLVCKAQYYAERKKPIPDDSTTFTMNQGKWADKYKIYDKRNAKGFQRDVEALIEHGLIECVECGVTTRTKSIYRFSSGWITYGTDDFHVSPTAYTAGMRNRKRKREKETND